MTDVIPPTKEELHNIQAQLMLLTTGFPPTLDLGTIYRIMYRACICRVFGNPQQTIDLLAMPTILLHIPMAAKLSRDNWARRARLIVDVCSYPDWHSGKRLEQSLIHYYDNDRGKTRIIHATLTTLHVCEKNTGVKLCIDLRKKIVEFVLSIEACDA